MGVITRVSVVSQEVTAEVMVSIEVKTGISGIQENEH